MKIQVKRVCEKLTRGDRIKKVFFRLARRRSSVKSFFVVHLPLRGIAEVQIDAPKKVAQAGGLGGFII